MTRQPEANSEQKHIAGLLGVNIDGDSERVAAARIKDTVLSATQPGRLVRPATEKQADFGEALGLDLAGDSLGVASAKIDDELFARNAVALKKLELKPGD